MSAAPDPFARQHEDLDAVLAFERRLADPAVRADREELAVLLHPDFEEVGRSGQHWHRDAMIDALVEEPDEGFELLQETAEFLGPGIILVTYGARALDAEHAASRHSSIWVHDEGLWKVRYHQGTPVS
jgi:ribonuclease HI